VEKVIVDDMAITIRHIIPTDDNSRLFPRDNMRNYPVLTFAEAMAKLFQRS
jgi:hypothetical protein